MRDRTAFVMGRVNFEFVGPAGYGEKIVTRLAVKELSRSTVTWDCSARRSQRTGGAPAGTGGDFSQRARDCYRPQSPLPEPGGRVRTLANRRPRHRGRQPHGATVPALGHAEGRGCDPHRHRPGGTRPPCSPGCGAGRRCRGRHRRDPGCFRPNGRNPAVAERRVDCPEGRRAQAEATRRHWASRPPIRTSPLSTWPATGAFSTPRTRWPPPPATTSAW